MKKTFELGQRWQELDSLLVKTEETFNMNMHEYMDLVRHYQDVAEAHNLRDQETVIAKLRELDAIKNEFNHEVKEQAKGSIFELV